MVLKVLFFTLNIIVGVVSGTGCVTEYCDVSCVLRSLRCNFYDKMVHSALEICHVSDIQYSCISNYYKNENSKFFKLTEQFHNLTTEFEKFAKSLDERIEKRGTKESVSDTGKEEVYPRNCYDLMKSGNATSGFSGIRTIYLESNLPVKVYCDQDTNGGGWTIIQRRKVTAKRENFNRTWFEYVSGFGDIGGEYWFGLNNIHALTNPTIMEVRFDLEDFEDDLRYANYDKFHVENAANLFRVNIGSYSGNAGDSFSKQNGMYFSTADKDNDRWVNSCAIVHGSGGWWYNMCHDSELNGLPKMKEYKLYQGKYADGIVWRAFRGYKYSLKSSEIKVRPIFR